MASLQLKRAARAPVIGLVPLIDVVFILLLFFMLATNFQRTGSIELAGGTVGSSQTAVNNDWLFVRIGISDVEIEGHAVKLSQLGEEVQKQLLGSPGRQVLVSAQDTVPVQRVVAVMDRLRANGIHQASFNLK